MGFSLRPPASCFQLGEAFLYLVPLLPLICTEAIRSSVLAVSSVLTTNLAEVAARSCNPPSASCSMFRAQVFFFLFFLINTSGMDADWLLYLCRHPECVFRCPLVAGMGAGWVTGQLSSFWLGFGFWANFFCP